MQLRQRQNNIHVLLVEDDEVDIMNVTRSFRKNKLPHQLSVTRNGVEALEWLRSDANEAPQVILLDVNMPRMNGFEFLSELRSDPSLARISVFVMSTSNNVSDKQQAHALNAAGYIVKPLSTEKFSETIRSLSGFWEICEYP